MDVVSTVFGADVTSQHLQTTLSGSVCRYSLTTQFGHHGADVDDLTVTLLHHCRQNSLRNDERSIQVDVDNATEIGSFHFVHRDTADDTCVVNQNINRAHFFFDSSHHSLNSRFVSYVAYITMCLDTLFGISSHTFVYQLLVDVVETDFRTLFCKSRSNGKTDTVRSTCYEGYFTFQRKIQILIHDVYLF